VKAAAEDARDAALCPGKSYIPSLRDDILLCEISQNRSHARQRNALRITVGKPFELCGEETNDVGEAYGIPHYRSFTKTKDAEPAQYMSLNLAC
jgi:hypothetical protein